MIEDLRAIDPNPYGTPMWGTKIEAWRERDRIRIENHNQECINNKRKSDALKETLSRSENITSSLVSYLNYLEVSKLENNINIFKDFLIEIFELPLLETYRKPIQYQNQVEKDYLFIKINQKSFYEKCNTSSIRGFEIELAITKSNYYHNFASYENRIKLEDIQELVNNFDYDLAFELKLNLKSTVYEMKNYRPMSDFFLK